MERTPLSIGQGTIDATLTADDVRELLARAYDPLLLDGKRVLVIIPDGVVNLSEEVPQVRPLKVSRAQD